MSKKAKTHGLILTFPTPRFREDFRPQLNKPQPSLLREIAAIAITLLVYGVTADLYAPLGYPVHG